MMNKEIARRINRLNREICALEVEAEVRSYCEANSLNSEKSADYAMAIMQMAKYETPIGRTDYGNSTQLLRGNGKEMVSLALDEVEEYDENKAKEILSGFEKRLEAISCHEWPKLKNIWNALKEKAAGLRGWSASRVVINETGEEILVVGDTDEKKTVAKRVPKNRTSEDVGIYDADGIVVIAGQKYAINDGSKIYANGSFKIGGMGHTSVTVKKDSKGILRIRGLGVSLWME